MPDNVAPTLGILSSLAVNNSLNDGRKGREAYSKSEDNEMRGKVPSSHKTIDDVASVLGINADKISPEMEEAIIKMLNELEYLHWKIKNLEGRLRYSEEKTDFHYLLQILNRGPFVRELERRIQHFNNVNLRGILLIFELWNFLDLREKYGITEAESALSHLARIIKNNAKSSYVIGSIDYGRIAVIMPFAEPEEAEGYAKTVKSVIKYTQFSIGIERIELSVRSGYAIVEPDDKAEGSIRRADMNLKP